MYPFTLYHASAVTTRRYTLYANSEKEREKWRKALVDAIGVRKVRQESNMVRIYLLRWIEARVLMRFFCV